MRARAGAAVAAADRPTDRRSFSRSLWRVRVRSAPLAAPAPRARNTKNRPHAAPTQFAALAPPPAR